MSGSRSVAAQHICVGSGSAFLDRNPQCLGTAKADVFLWAFMPLYLEHFPNTFTSGTLRKALEMQALQFKQIGSYCPQLSPSGTQKDWKQTHSRCCHWLSGKGLTSLVLWNLWADRRLKRENGPWSLLN